MPPVNRLVTRGMGTSRGTPGRAGMVTQGYGGIFKAVVKAVSTVILGGSRALRRLPEILWSVCARLTEVNDRELLSGTEGTDKKLVDPNLAEPKVAAELESTGISRRPSDIVIVADRVDRSKKREG